MSHDDLVHTVRASGTSKWPDCPRREAAKAFRPLITAHGYELHNPMSNVGAIIGSAVHRGSEVAMSEKLSRGEAGPLQHSIDAAIEEGKKRSSEEGCYFDDAAPTINDRDKQIIRMTEAYYTAIVPKVQPITVERRLEARIPWVRQNIVLSGQSDQVAREPNAIRDTKTGKMRGNHKPQIGCYGLLERANGAEIDVGIEDFVQRVSLKKPQPAPVTFSFDIAECESAAVSIIKNIDASLTTYLEGDITRNIAAGDPASFMANPSSSLCSNKFCPAWGTAWCKEGMTR